MSNNVRNPNQSMVQYNITKNHLSLIQDILSPEKAIRFSRVTNRLKIDWDWSEQAEVGKYIVAEAYVLLDPETYPEIYKDRLLKNYVTALFKRLVIHLLIELSLPLNITFSIVGMFILFFS